ncbi:DUF2512 family protein [Sediminibacillus dalangtanensis]|uniref:DUF2512 family protein n=1 Tax=Sediminibacillus dalangtanensis TaxID=2729421 RepID=A0ABX7VZQ6_9BACI|nr:YndM family protein [Sediminibacillus dalangtanensis]QTN00242.1 DUF2512 family protein [Sediminibacillus dalangtanensis]
MEHVRALVIKFAVTGIVLYSILGIFYTATVGDIFIITLLVTGVAYLLGDLFILPRFGNLTASIADFGLAFAAVWILSAFFIGTDVSVVNAALFSALFIAAAEVIFHMYMQNRVLDDEPDYEEANRQTTARLQTEFADESEGQDIIELQDGKTEEKKDE